ncbi:hypothetical protein HaLaN_27765, partial [Haematococcus lacustris]
PARLVGCSWSSSSSQGCLPFTAELTRVVRCLSTSTTLPGSWSMPLGLHSTFQQARNTASAPQPPLVPMLAAPKNSTSCLARPWRSMDSSAMLGMTQSTTLQFHFQPTTSQSLTPPSTHPPSPSSITAPAPGPGLRTASAAAVPTWGPGWPPGRCRLSLLLPGAGGGAGLEPATVGWCGGSCSGHWPASPGPWSPAGCLGKWAEQHLPHRPAKAKPGPLTRGAVVSV